MRTLLAIMLVTATATVANAQGVVRQDKLFGHGRITEFEPVPTPEAVAAAIRQAAAEARGQVPLTETQDPSQPPRPVIGGGDPVPVEGKGPPRRVALTMNQPQLCNRGRLFTDQTGRQWILKYVTVPNTLPLGSEGALNGWIIPIEFGDLFITDGGRVYQPYVP